MIKTLLIIFFIFLCLADSSFAEQSILSIQGYNVAPYESALKGFESVTGTQTKKIILSENDDFDFSLPNDTYQPDLILAIGIEALSKISHIKDLPIVYAMVLNPRPKILGSDRATGVSMNVAPEHQLAIFKKGLPDVKRIGLIYDPENTGFFVERAELESKKTGLVLVAEPIGNPKEIPSKLMKMKNDIDAFWMLPDVAVLTQETIEMFVLFSLENRIPILTFSDKYLKLGAVLSVGMDPFEIGRQAGKMAKRIVNGTDPSLILPEYADKAVVTINFKTAKTLGLRINADILTDEGFTKTR